MKKDKKPMELGAIDDVIEKHCNNCGIKKEICKKFDQSQAYVYCVRLCPVGKGLKNIGDSMVNGNVRKAEELDQETYEIEAVKMTDKEIANKWGISTTTLTRRKQKWGITRKKMRDFSEKLNPEIYLSYKKMKFSDEEIAKTLGISFMSLRRWKARENVSAPSTLELLLENKSKKDYFQAMGRLGNEEAIAREWGTSPRTMRRWRKEKGIRAYAN